MYKIGIMTFHAAHNFGSVLQAYATQQVLTNLGYDSEIINYRLKTQLAFYNDLYTARFGLKQFIQRLLCIPEHRERQKRSVKFEDFIRTRLKLSEGLYNTFPELCEANLDYDVLLSGSDQVWNCHCHNEFATEPPESVLGYFLAFCNDNDHVTKVSFSSSIGAMEAEEILNYRKYLDQYKHIAVREGETAKSFSKLLNREIVNTLDPTLMLNAEEWKIEGTYKPEGRYIFVYTLKKHIKANQLVRDVRDLGKRLNLEVVCIAPLSDIRISGVCNIVNSGPLDFLSYIRNAQLVVTDSYHGTAFSINFGKEFYSVAYGGRFDFRIKEMLMRFGLVDRIIKDADVSEAPVNTSNPIDYDAVRIKLASLREDSIKYLQDALR